MNFDHIWGRFTVKFNVGLYIIVPNLKFQSRLPTNSILLGHLFVGCSEWTKSAQQWHLTLFDHPVKSFAGHLYVVLWVCSLLSSAKPKTITRAKPPALKICGLLPRTPSSATSIVARYEHQQRETRLLIKAYRPNQQ